MADDSASETHAKARVAEAIRRHVDQRFGGNLKRAAEDLGFERQRLYSYTSRANFPGSDVFDVIKEKWALDLLNVDTPTVPATLGRDELADSGQLRLLFDPPVRLANEGVEIILEQRGPAVSVSITVSPDVRRLPDN